MEYWYGKRKAEPAKQSESKKKKTDDVLSEAPREVDVVRYAESHASEIQVLSSKVEIIGGGKNIAQKVPVHMRRRAMSHNVKRLPRSIRGLAKHLVGTKQKKPSRYHRRRPKNLLQEYARRQRKHVWLETHIWHAKRFHMIDKWGYKLPWKPTMKSERACYRATSRYCLLQDLSFMSCLEIEGPQQVIMEGLAHVTSPETGKTFAAVSCLSGTREGQTIMYECDRYPWNAIGPVSFMWDPSVDISGIQENNSVSNRRLWIWCHPSTFHQIWKELLGCLNLQETNKFTAKVDSTSLDTDKSENKTMKENGNTKPFICDKYKTSVVGHNADKQITMKSLTGSLLRFCLTGPQSTAVLVDTLQQANIESVKYPDENGSSWWKDYYSKPEHSSCHVTQKEFMETMEKCQSPSELPPHCVIAMTARDPRLTRPDKRAKLTVDEESIRQDMSAFREKLSKAVSTSPLWLEAVREEVSSTKLTDHRIHELKSQKLVPGLPLELGDEESRIPVIVIQRPGVTTLASTGCHAPNLGRGSGFDLLVPKGWGMAFWLALVFRGARCAGLRERECNAYEEKSCLFPNDFPDTLAGHQYQVDLEKERVEKYNRVPPAKRPNFTKYGVVSPFYCPWDLLVKEWNTKDEIVVGEKIVKLSPDSKMENKNGLINVTERVEDNTNGVSENNQNDTAMQDDDSNAGESRTVQFYVLRNAKLLRQLQSMCEVQKNRWKARGNRTDVLDTIEREHTCSIIAVRLDMVQKGSPGQFATICLPSIDDLEQFSKNKSYGGPVEPIKIDPVLIEKQKLKKEMKQKGITGKVKVDRNLKLIREKQGVVVRTGSRDVLGYLNSGGYSLGTGNGVGVGFVSSVALIKLLRTSLQSGLGPVVLVRENSSLQYRYARLSIITT